MDIILATSNDHKVKAIQSVLDRQVQHITLDLSEIQTINVGEVIEQKARSAYHLVGKPVLVEDTSLSFHAWNGLPGALIRWFVDTVGNEGICQMLIGYEQREATAQTCLGYFDGREFVSFSGMLNGEIAKNPRGSNGFGWDPIFIPASATKTLAEMTLDELANVNSMRTAAALKLKAYLDQF